MNRKRDPRRVGTRSRIGGVRAVLTLAIALLAQASFASNGVLEISRTCAVQTGCFSGDAAGYPVTINGTAGSSYRLTSDLIVPDENTDGIVVGTSDISIDLNDFTIIRSGCVGATTDCTPASGSGSGVERTSSSDRGISVKNGSITGMGFYGVLLGDQAEADGLRVRWNRTDGINAGFGSTVSGNTAYGNVRDGISAANGSTVRGNTAFANLGNGIKGISGSSVQSNTVRQNGGYGLNLTADTGYRENVISNNSAGTVLGGLDLRNNSCDGTTTCP